MFLSLTVFSNKDSSSFYFNQGLFHLYKQKHLGICHMNLGESQKAINQYTKALDVDAKFVQARYNKAYCMYKLGQFTEALPEFDRVIKETIDFAKAYFYRGMCQISLNQFKASCKDLSKAASLEYVEAEMALEIFCEWDTEALS